jgi:hypothetical protein
MKNIPGIKLESAGESRYGKKISEFKKELGTLKADLRERRKRVELAVLRIPKIIKEIELERKTDAAPSGAEAELELMLSLKRTEGNVADSLEKKIKEIEKSIDELTALEEHFRGKPRADT